MKRYKNILVPVDGSKLSNLAFEQALSLAKMISGEVTVIHVIVPIQNNSLPFELTDIDLGPEVIVGLETENKKRVRSMLTDLVNNGKKEGVKVNQLIKEGNVASEIIDESSKFDLIIMGSLGQSALTKLFLGSVAEKVSRHACCPVMLVREIGKECMV